MSLGGLYHYFATKRELLLHGLAPEAFARICVDFFAEYGYLEEEDPERFLEVYVEFQMTEISFIRPSLLAALELGAVTFTGELERGMQEGLDGFVAALRRIIPDPEQRDLELVARAIRRILFAAVLDGSVTADELRQELWAVISGEPIGCRLHSKAGPVTSPGALAIEV